MQEEASLKTCLRCSRTMAKDAAYVEIEIDKSEEYLHPECFQCVDCSESLVGKDYVLIGD